MPLIGYARVSTEDQTPLPQSQALKSAGCAEIHEEQASGGNRARPVLARVLERIAKGDTLVVVRIDRLARSLSHLLEVIERLEAKLEQYPDQLARACVDLAKDWRTDRYLRRLEAMLLVADASSIFTVTGVGAS